MASNDDYADLLEIDEEALAASFAYEEELEAISRKAREEVDAMFARLAGLDTMESVTAVEEGVVEIFRNAHRAASEAAAAYYDAERGRQIGPDDGFKAQVLEFTEEDERSIRAWVRYNARSLFEDEGE